jgi:hypothetical protein
MQKAYDRARAGFAALEKDRDLGDPANYKVFLCDLLGGQENAVHEELSAFNRAAENPSYCSANGTLCITKLTKRAGG